MASITIPKDYFDTLIRRAELHHASENLVTINTSEYNTLHQSLREYTLLRAALLAGGATAETLDVLINTPIPALPNIGPHVHLKSGTTKDTKPWSEAPTFVPATQSFQTRRNRAPSTSTPDWRADPIPKSVNPSPISTTPESHVFRNTEEKSSATSDDGQGAEPSEKVENNHEDRTLIFKGLSNATTLADVAKVVRGGPVFNLVIRAHDREALVSFVDPIAAENFLIYSKRTDIYVRGKRVKVLWADRQYYMPGHIAHKVSRFGASRNLAIRFPKEGMAPDSVRDDLEHIDRLEIVEIRMLDGKHLLVSTNDISLAMTARTCMCSRLKYKGSRVEFFADECGEALAPVSRRAPEPRSTQRSITKSLSTLNRFQLLALNDSEEDIAD